MQQTDINVLPTTVSPQHTRTLFKHTYLHFFQKYTSVRPTYQMHKQLPFTEKGGR